MTLTRDKRGEYVVLGRNEAVKQMLAKSSLPSSGRSEVWQILAGILRMATGRPERISE